MQINLPQQPDLPPEEVILRIDASLAPLMARRRKLTRLALLLVLTGMALAAAIGVYGYTSHNTLLVWAVLPFLMGLFLAWGVNKFRGVTDVTIQALHMARHKMEKKAQGE